MTQALDGRRAKGTALVARKTIELLLRHQDEFELTFIHFKPTEDPIYEQGIRELLFPRLPGMFHRGPLEQMAFFLRCREEFDAVQWFQPRLFPFFWRLPTRNIIVTVHGGGDVFAPAPFEWSRHLLNATLRFARKHINHAIVVSEFAKQEVQDAYGLVPRQVEVVYNGIDDSFRRCEDMGELERVRSHYQLPRQFFLNVGRLVAHKNVARLIQSFERYCMDHSESEMHLVNIGVHGDEEKFVRSLVAMSSVKERIHLVSYIEDSDLAVVYSLAEALVFVSLNEGFGLPVIEAMACGTPVITSDTTSLPEIAGGAALLVSPMDTAQIAAAMHHLQSDQAERAALIQRGLDRVQRFRGWHDHEEGMLRLYRGLKK